MTYRKLVKIHWLSQDAEQALLLRHETEIAELLPILGPLFGIAVLTFGLWDHFIDPRHALTTFAMSFVFCRIRIACLFFKPAALEHRTALLPYLLDARRRHRFMRIHAETGLRVRVGRHHLLPVRGGGNFHQPAQFFLMISLPTALLLVRGGARFLCLRIHQRNYPVRIFRHIFLHPDDGHPLLPAQCLLSRNRAAQ